MRIHNLTVKDIARALNLSVSTVSRALRNGYEISQETKNKVQDYAKKNNYQPNPIALNLRQKRSNTIGVIISEISNNFFAQAIEGMDSVANLKGFNLVVTQTHESKIIESKHIQNFASRGVDGLLISLSNETTDISYLQELQVKGMPIVQFDRISLELNTHKVTSDNFQSAMQATLHLLSQGFKNIAHITSTKNLSTTKDRIRGYKQALSLNNIKATNRFINFCNNQKMVEDTINNLFMQKIKPDAILAGSDKITIATFETLKKMNKLKNIGLVGFSNTPLADLTSPSLSVVHQPAFEMGQKSIELLLELIESRRPITEFRTITFENKFIIRESSVCTLTKVDRQ